MDKTKRKSVQAIMRQLHRDIGFLLIGLTFVFSLSGIVLIYRDTNVFKIEKHYKEQLSLNLKSNELKEEINIRRLRITSESQDEIVFDSGSYNKTTGIADYTLMEYPTFISKLNNIHKAISRETLHWVIILYGVLLFFLAISSFWMYKPGSKNFKRGLILGGAGIAFALILVFIYM